MEHISGVIYRDIRIKEAVNGWILMYSFEAPNPMAAKSTFDSGQTIHMDKKKLFEAGPKTTMEQALDKALVHYKELIISNMEDDKGSHKVDMNTGHKG